MMVTTVYLFQYEDPPKDVAEQQANAAKRLIEKKKKYQQYVFILTKLLSQEVTKYNDMKCDMAFSDLLLM